MKYFVLGAVLYALHTMSESPAARALWQNMSFANIMEDMSAERASRMWENAWATGVAQIFCVAIGMKIMARVLEKRIKRREEDEAAQKEATAKAAKAAGKKKK